MMEWYDELLMKGKELTLFKLKQLEKQFILSQEEMLWELEIEKLNALDNFNKCKEELENYKSLHINSL